MIVSCALIIVTLMQTSNASGLPKAITGGDTLKLFSAKKERGTDKIIVVVTIVLIIAYFVLAYISGRFGL